MPRSQFTFTFRNAEPGASVTFSAAVYSSAVDQVADGPALVLDSARTVAVWSDVSPLSATWVDGAGDSITAWASLDRPVVVETRGVPGASPAATGGSGAWTEHVISTTEADWTVAAGTFTFVGGAISQTDPDVDGSYAYLTVPLGVGGVVVVQADLTLPTGQGAALGPLAFALVSEDPNNTKEFGLGVAAISSDVGDLGTLGAGSWAGAAPLQTSPPVAFGAQGDAHTLRFVGSTWMQTLYLDGVLVQQIVPQGASVAAGVAPANAFVAVGGAGLFTVENFKVWTLTLPA